MILRGGKGGEESEFISHFLLFFLLLRVMYISRTENFSINSIQQAIALEAKTGHCVEVLTHRAFFSASNAYMAHFGPC